ncbi:hypothetical protein TNCV_2549361 [Trichonephila clavipes]|nr:hypothetical protein TNCV_2549361 [Trichonephila clavipes]
MPTCFITRASQCPSNCPLPRFPGMTAIPKSCASPCSRANNQAQRCSIQLPRECPSSSGTPPVTQECARGIPALLREGQV